MGRRIVLLLLWGVWGAACLASNEELAVPKETQWTLRFLSRTSLAQAEVGCLGTASYQYELPPVEYLKAFRKKLKEKAFAAGVEGYAWSSDEHKNGERYLVDLNTGAVVYYQKGGSESARAAVFCVCRSAKLKNCTPSALPPLGSPFKAKQYVEVPDEE